MTFTYDLTTDVGKLRLLAGDTIQLYGPRPAATQPSALTNFSDEELQHLIDVQNGIVGRALCVVFDTLAAEWTIFTNITLGPRKEEFGRVAEQFAARASRARIQYGAGIPYSVGLDRVDGYSEAADEASGL